MGSYATDKGDGEKHDALLDLVRYGKGDAVL